MGNGIGWHLYLLRCADNSLYTGISRDVPRRLREHEGGSRGAKYLQGRGPFTLVFDHAVGDRSVASRVEYHIKRLPKHQKERLLRAPADFRAYLRVLADDFRESRSQRTAPSRPPSAHTDFA